MTVLDQLAAAAAAEVIAPTGLNPVRLFLDADIVVQVVMVGLLAASVWVWTIIVSFTMRMAGVRRASAAFEQAFWEHDDPEGMISRGKADNPSGRVAAAGLTEFRKSTRSGLKNPAQALALICHLANNAYGPVSAKALEQALGWADYLESHARRAYASVTVDNAEAARAIWRRIKRGDLPGTFTARDIQRKGWSGLKDKVRLATGLAALCDADWLAADNQQTGGRPSTVYTVNPKALQP